MNINFNKIKNQIKQTLNILAKKASLVFLFLIIIYFIFGGILIYRYGVLAQRTEILDIETKQNTIKENAYQKILEHWEVKKIKFNEIDETIYPNPFIKKTLQKIDEQPAEKEKTPAETQVETKEKMEKEETKKNDSEPITESFFEKIGNLFEYYTSGGKRFLSIDERAKIWEQEGMGKTEEYQGFYNQNIKLLEQLTK